MTKDKLKKEAEEYFKSICGDYNEEYERTGKRHYWVGFDIKNAYLASAEPREKRIVELEAQIEKMQEKLKADLIAKLEEQIQYSTSPSCTKGMELFIKSIEKWEIKEK